MSSDLLSNLRTTIGELSDRYSHLSSDDVFSLWFLRAFVTSSEQQASSAVVGGSGDKSNDAILIDDAAKCVFVVQSKYRKSLGKTNEQRSHVIAFADIANGISTESDSDFKQYCDQMEEFTAARAKEARRRILKDGYRLHLFFVTLWKVSPTTRRDAELVVRRARCQAAIEIIDGKRTMVIFRDYLDGVAPPVPTLDLELERVPGVQSSAVSNRFDEANNIDSWVFSMRGDAVGAMFEAAGIRLFARNIRGFMGLNTPVNRGMLETLDTEPDRFFYYNNGVTIICDRADKKTSRGREVLQVSNPQIINGQQTTRTLASSIKQAAQAAVLVKVICVPREDRPEHNDYDELVSQIVAGTNWQNAIKPSDLMSNDRRQIELESALRNRGYLYVRKRQTKGEARSHGGGKSYRLLKKEELAQAVAGCNLDPVIIRSGRENLFEEDRYKSIFPNSDPNFYLPRYWLFREITYWSKGVPARGYTKWMVLNYMWSEVAPSIRTSRMSNGYVRASERRHQHERVIRPLGKAIKIAFDESLRYFREHRGSGDAQLDLSLFFKNRKNHHKHFVKHWRSVSEKQRQRFRRNMRGFHAALERVVS
jgi:hypothetical protein